MVVRPLTALVLAGALALGACGGGGSSSSGGGNNSGGGGSSKATATPTQASGGGSAKVPVAAASSGALKFTTSTLKAKAGKITFTFDNPSQVPHAFAIKGHGSSKTITGGKTTLTVKLKPGTYQFFCPVDGHAAAGMRGTLTVS